MASVAVQLKPQHDIWELLTLTRLWQWLQGCSRIPQGTDGDLGWNLPPELSGRLHWGQKSTLGQKHYSSSPKCYPYPPLLPWNSCSTLSRWVPVFLGAESRVCLEVLLPETMVLCWCRKFFAAFRVAVNGIIHMPQILKSDAACAHHKLSPSLKKGAIHKGSILVSGIGFQRACLDTHQRHPRKLVRTAPPNRRLKKLARLLSICKDSSHRAVLAVWWILELVLLFRVNFSGECDTLPCDLLDILGMEESPWRRQRMATIWQYGRYIAIRGYRPPAMLKASFEFSSTLQW